MLRSVMQKAGWAGASIKLTVKHRCKLAKYSYGATAHSVTEHNQWLIAAVQEHTGHSSYGSSRGRTGIQLPKDPVSAPQMSWEPHPAPAHPQHVPHPVDPSATPTTPAAPPPAAWCRTLTTVSKTHDNGIQQL